MSKAWIGVDLDGTLAHYDKWIGPEHIGKPIQPTLDRVKLVLQAGYNVKIFTARVAPNNPERFAATAAINLWTAKHVGRTLISTATKDFNMIELWDDRAVAVEHNTGRLLSPSQFIR